MRQVNFHKQPEHGLQIEDTLAAGDVEGVQHLYRYWYAWSLSQEIKAQKIWDLGCGCGYGARILAESLAEVFAVDADARALRASLSDYGDRDNIKFAKAFLDMSWDDKYNDALRTFPAADLVCCFELLEQVRNRDAFLVELHEAISPDTLVIFSCHDIHARTSWSADNGYIRYNKQMLERVLRNAFKTVTPLAEAGFAKEFIADANELTRTANRTPFNYNLGNGVYVCRK